MFLYKVTEKEVHKIIEDLDNKSSSGDDYISNLKVMVSKQAIVQYLTHLINLTFKNGVFPEALRKAKVIPLYKDGSKTDENNLIQPIFLLIVWSKLFERAMYTRMYNYMESFSLLFKK